MKHTLTYWRKRAKEEGYDWSEVRELYDEIRAIRLAEREHEWEILKLIHKYTVISNGWDERYHECWWRGALRLEYPDAFDGGDQDCIPGFDVVAEWIAESFPEFAPSLHEYSADKLWRFLNEVGYRPAPGPEDIMPEVFDYMASSTVAVADDDAVPF